MMPVACQTFVEETEMKRQLGNINMDCMIILKLILRNECAV
jgi:hypothetical protein